MDATAGVAVSRLEALGGTAMTGVRAEGAASTTDAGLSDGATSPTAGSEICAGATRSGPSARTGAFTGAAWATAFRFDLAPAVIRAAGGIATALLLKGDAGDMDGVGAGPLATRCSIDACCTGSATDVIAGSPAVTCVGTSTTRTSGTSIRRAPQGTPKPGSPSPWPPKI